MSLDFRNIRQHRGTQNGGFEELCCQLAALEDPAAGSRFIRKGPGADQGLECYRTYAGAHEVGWQAKYFIDGFEDGQVGDLADSLKRALSAHPQLTKFVVCLPIDLRDNRAGKKASEVQRYERWRSKSVEAAAAAGRTLEIKLWSASSIGERLRRDDPMYSGRARYWFDAVTFSSAWFRDKLDVQRHNLGERYSPESHVELPVHRALEGVARNAELLAEPSEWIGSIKHMLDSALRRFSHEKLPSVADRIRKACEPLLHSLDAPPTPLETCVPLDQWAALATAAIESISEAVIEVKARAHDKAFGNLNGTLWQLSSTIESVRDEFSSVRWRLTNKRELLVSGPGGIGKSHLIADFGHKQLERCRPFILVLSGSLTDGDPWEQIRVQLDLTQFTTADFLGALDAAAEAAGSRAVLAIDALNERHGIALWETRLPGFIRSINKFPRLALVLTVRTTYLRFFPLNEIENVVHPGFAGQTGAAARAYLHLRGIAGPSSPNLAREFENPLFLRTCCEYLDAEGLKQLPKGADGISAIFDFYLAAVAGKLERELKLVPELKIPLNALEQFLKACADERNGGSMSTNDALNLLEGIHNSGGYRNCSLFSAFLSEGVLTQDVEWTSGGGHKEIVRFTFERLSDHLRARSLIQQIDRADVEGTLRRTLLAPYLRPNERKELSGVVEALAVQLPEEFNLELFDVLPKDAFDDQSFRDAFESSLAWRRSTAFTGRTVGWVDHLCKATGRSAYLLMLLVSTEPEGLFNANWLHKDLWPRPMPLRDAVWSVFLALDDLSDGGAVASLIYWAWNANAKEVDEPRRWLASVTLTWFLATSNRAVRDRATKALVNLLSCDLRQAANLVDMFVDVDDPYIIERLLAACYGAAMQCLDLARLKLLAAAVWKNFFAEGRQPPLNVLARDYAFGVVLFAQSAGQLPPEVDLAACRAKFTSAWPLETVTHEDLEKYRGRESGDSIYSSMSEHAHFGNFIVDHWLWEITDSPRALLDSTQTRDDEVPPSKLEYEPIRRWICERAHQLGWTEELFGTLERKVDFVRDSVDTPRVERIGMKYQYIALSEATARATDNLAMCSWYEECKLWAFEPGPLGRAKKCDLDPSALIQSTLESSWGETVTTWWVPSACRLVSGNTEQLLAWANDERDLCNGVDQIEVTSPIGDEWLTVECDCRWALPGESLRSRAEALSHITCLVTALGNGPQLAKELLTLDYIDSFHEYRSSPLLHFLGEHGWRSARPMTLESDFDTGIETPHAFLVESLEVAPSLLDNSLSELGFSLYLPTAGIIKTLDLHRCSGKESEYVDAGGTLRWQDPSLRQHGPKAVVVSRDYFLSKLASAGLEPVWMLAGKKEVHSAPDIGKYRGDVAGSLFHTTAFLMKAGVLKSLGTRTEFHAPNAEQLKRLQLS